MSSWRKKLFGLIVVTLVVLAFVFRDTMAGACFLIILVQSFQVYLYNHYSSTELAKQFQEDGKHVKGWR